MQQRDSDAKQVCFPKGKVIYQIPLVTLSVLYYHLSDTTEFERMGGWRGAVIKPGYREGPRKKNLDIENKQNNKQTSVTEQIKTSN